MESFPQFFIPGIQNSATATPRSAAGVEWNDLLHDESSPADAALPAAGIIGDTGPVSDGQDSVDVPVPLGMRKRKAVGDPSPPAKRSAHGDGSDDSRAPGANKLLCLPPEIWHHIFTFIPPRTLGNLMQTSKLFNLYLDVHSSVMASIPASMPGGSLSFLKPDAIWQASRRCFWPRMPAPLKGCSERDMWRLICSSRCQICGKNGTPFLQDDGRKTTEEPVANAGTTPLFLVLPFSVRICAECLGQKTSKEIDILLSPTMPSILVPALPFAFITDQMVPTSPASLQYNRFESWPRLQLTKIYWKEHVAAIKDEFEMVKKMGLAAAEEWIKGLEDRGKEARNDHARWEKWGAAGGFPRMRTTLCSGGGSVHQAPNNVAHTTNVLAAKPMTGQASASGADGVVPPQARTAAPVKIKQERTREDVELVKDQRRSEIEHRAMLLEPPLPAKVLAYIPSFQAAIQISAALDDVAWEVLKPRLLAQRDEAERLARQDMEQEKQAQEKLEEKRATALAKEAVDRQWDDMQGPVRAKLADLADQTIQEKWNEGRRLNKDSCLRFAAQVLANIRTEFYADVAKEEALARASGQPRAEETPEGPWTRKLTLENMKWVFDLKIKPHTEPLRKELFACSGCEGNGRLYGLEGVIQHYAAKHTESLSQGSAVVYWRAEWPHEQPFKLDPRLNGHGQAQNAQAKRSLVPTSVPSTAQDAYQATVTTHQSFNTVTGSAGAVGQPLNDAHPPFSGSGSTTVPDYRHGLLHHTPGPMALYQVPPNVVPPQLALASAPPSGPWIPASHDNGNYSAHAHPPAATQRPDRHQEQQTSSPYVVGEPLYQGGSSAAVSARETSAPDKTGRLVMPDIRADRAVDGASARAADIPSAYPQERSRSRSPVYVRYEQHDAQRRNSSQPHLHYEQQQHRRRSPVTAYHNVGYRQGEAAQYEYVRAPSQRRQNVYHVYADEVERQVSPPRHAQTYEIIQGRDEYGEYIIRRPVRIRRDHESEDDRRIQYREMDEESLPHGRGMPMPESHHPIGYGYHGPTTATREYESRHYRAAPHAGPGEGAARVPVEIRGPSGREYGDIGPGDDYDPRYPTGYPAHGSGDGTVPY